MREAIRVLVLGTGQMGSSIARLVQQKPRLVLAGGFARRPERAGLDLGQAIGVNRRLEVPIETDLDDAIARSRPDIAIQATGSLLADVWEELWTLLRSRVPVISIAEEMAYPAASSPDLARELDRLAVEQGVAALGTGINPGFVLDLLVLALSGVCAEVESIRATRTNDLAPYGKSVLQAQGVGLTVAAFEAGIANGTVTGHHGFPESMHMIATALGWSLERIEQSRRPIVSRVRRETPFAVVEPGCVAGCLHTAIGYRSGRPAITLIHPQQVRPELEQIETGDSLEIIGTPTVRMTGSPEIPGGVGTTALAVNMIPRVLTAPPGLYCMADLPVPRAMSGEARGPLRPRLQAA